ncbi:uncharacterized protein [Lolium perenne]|uniref:uncharacterized protein isoform X2 n=1 Tax=Lolium perenne TaxID=4522 RepID=UPI003A99930E
MRAALSLAFNVGSTTGSFGVEGLTWKMLRSQETEAGLHTTYKLIVLSGCCFNAGILLMLHQVCCPRLSTSVRALFHIDTDADSICLVF